MRTLLLTALLLAVTPGAGRADGGAPPSQAEKPAPPAQAKGTKGGDAKPSKAAPGKGEGKGKAAGASGTKTKTGDAGAKDAAAPEPKPCEPVKPCPID